ncbi:Tat binding protein 1-interacting protein-domain-containing protein [Kockiozyma suomiensis]|uniref:Tat binding protein 1-interacting protein-domain-containing protein n=1 Tax=Kockiozyma suomiensis TaxID=1337062 RepID=UPI0033439A26
MAPKKEKQDDEEIEAKVLLYMQTQNRPYSSTDVFQNMHGEIARAGINRALAALETRGELLGKTYGKQIVYVIKQSAPNDTGGDSKQAEEEECEKKDVEAEVDAVVRRASELRAELAELKKQPATSALLARDAELDELIEKEERNLARLRQLSSANPTMTREKAEGMRSELRLMTKEWTRRRKMFYEVWNAVAENMETKGDIERLWDELALEEDSVKIADVLGGSG